MNFLKAFTTISGLTLLSRLLGFVRDKLIANYLGAGSMADIWTVVFRLPNLFRRIFGEGAFNSAFVPMYSGRLDDKTSNKEADEFAGKTMSLMIWLLLGISLLCFVFMGPIISTIATGFSGEQLETTVSLSRITIFYLVFVCLVAAFSGVMNSRNSFGPPAFAYTLLNVVFLVALIFIVPKSDNPISVLAWSTIISGVIQLGFIVFSCLKRGIRIPLSFPKIDGDMKRLGALMIPGLASAGIQQLNLLVGQSVASHQTGGNASIYYSDRINQLPLGLIGVAIGVILLPEITKFLKKNELGNARNSLSHGMEVALFLTLPATIAMMVIPNEIIHAIFVGGKFGSDSVDTAAQCLAAFAIGTPAYILLRVFQPIFFAQEDTKTPMIYTGISALVNIALCWPMFKHYGVQGCALATSIAGWVNLTCLAIHSYRINFLSLGFTEFSKILRILICSVLMGVVIWFVTDQLRDRIMTDGQFLVRLCVLLGVVALGVVVYFLTILLTKTFTVADFKRGLKRPS